MVCQLAKQIFHQLGSGGYLEFRTIQESGANGGENPAANLPDTEINEIIRKWAIEVGISQGEICAEEIVDRCVYALVNEGARILEKGIAKRAVDIDVIYVNGYGFPSYRGGPCGMPIAPDSRTFTSELASFIPGVVKSGNRRRCCAV